MAVIDEIQLLRDPGRGWAWTRALLGIIAEEIHVCGEPGSVDLLKKMCETTGESVEVFFTFFFFFLSILFYKITFFFVRFENINA